MKKKKLSLLRADVPVSWYEYVVAPFIGVHEESGMEGLFWVNFDDAGEYIPARYDSINYNSLSEFAFAWKSGEAIFYYTPYYDYFGDEYSEYEIKSEYKLPYSEIRFTGQAQIEHLYFAKKEGKWGVVNGITNQPISDFSWNNPKQIDIEELDWEMK